MTATEHAARYNDETCRPCGTCYHVMGGEYAWPECRDCGGTGCSTHHGEDDGE